MDKVTLAAPSIPTREHIVMHKVLLGGLANQMSNKITGMVDLRCYIHGSCVGIHQSGPIVNKHLTI